jgi:small-conductance mechanosensitive channel
MVKEDNLNKIERREVSKMIDKKISLENDNLSLKEKKAVVAEINKKVAEKLKSQASEVKNEFKKQVSGAIIAAFGLIIALSWKDVITELVNQFAIVKSYGLIVSALILTFISVMGIMIISKWAKSGSSEVKK